VVKSVGKSVVREVEGPYTAVLTHGKDMRGCRADHLIANDQRIMNALATAGGGRADPDPTGLHRAETRARVKPTAPNHRSFGRYSGQPNQELSY
jgi:hypothetical protein